MINENNYETFFMSYIDNELNTAERAAVEAFVLTDSKYAEAMAVFEKTKLHAPNVEMEDKIFLYRFPEMEASLDTDFKNSLYRKEAPVRRVLFTPNLMRASFAIAAMLILFIGLQLFKSDSPLLESNIVESPLKDKTAVASTDIILPTKDKILTNAAIAIKAITKNRTENQNENQNENQTILASTNNTSNSINTNIVSTTEGLSQTSRENENNKKLTAKFNEAQISSTAMETMATEEEKIILPTNYKEIDTEEEDRTINIGILEIDAAAFRGITRKFSALLKRNKIEK